MDELVLNIHSHTTYSDGTKTHEEIGQIALQSDVDVVITTDHNVLVSGVDGYYRDDQHKILLLTGEEIHNQNRNPQKSHLLVVGNNRELAMFGNNTQQLIHQVKIAGGYTFLAHPFEDALPLFGELDIGWDDWQIEGFTGIEVWNGMSEFKCAIRGKASAIFFTYFPQFIANGPHPSAKKKWDELTSAGRRVVAIGGGDAHALNYSMAPFTKTLFPYLFHFKGINNHLLTSNSLTDDLSSDRKMIFNSLANGRLFIGYDLPGCTRGFRFYAQGRDGTANMGEDIQLTGGVTFQIRLPHPVECHLLKDGKVIKTWHERQLCTCVVSQPGVYRVECYINYLGRKRGWIYSNPIYVRAND
jgi:hypothetical protein